MSPNAQRIAIAEACGYSRQEAGSPWFDCPDDRQIHIEDLPDYLNDLNAMHEAEKLIGPIKGIELCWHLNEMGISGEWEILTATAAQRADAFLRTIGKWVE
jgi:hypothetical protein